MSLRTIDRFTQLLALLLLASLATPLLAQGDEPQSLFIDRVDVNVINVEVFVTDRQGNRVTDLTAEDFEISEDGQPVEISNFYSVAYEDQVLKGLDRDRAAIEAGNTPAATARPADQQLNLVVYVDHFNLSPQNQKRVLDNLGGFLEDRVNQGDQIMLVGYNRKVKVVQPFTRDRARVLDGLNKLKKTATYRQVDEQQRREVMRRIAPSPSGRGIPTTSPDQAYMHLRAYVEQARLDLRASTTALASVVRSLAGMPGRTSVLYVSDGLPKRPGEDLYQVLSDLYGVEGFESNGAQIDPLIESLNENQSQILNNIIRHANAHQVTLYTLDARGTRGASTESAQYNVLTPAPGGRTGQDAINTFSYQESLLDLSDATGGTAILNTFNFDGAFADLSEDLDSFYSLGYRSKHGGDGEYHKIDVRVKRPGLKVRHRAGFVDKPEQERVADRTFSSLLFNMESNPLGIALDFGQPDKQGRKQFHLPILVRIPFDNITLLPNGDNVEGRLKIFIAVQDEKGAISDLQEIPYPVQIPAAQTAAAKGQQVGYQTTLLIREGVPKIAVGVWDELSGDESFVHKSVLVGKPPKGATITRSGR